MMATQQLLGPWRVLPEMQPWGADIPLPTRSLSFWSVRSYLTCPYCWEQKFIHHAGDFTGTTFAIGKMVHGALDSARKAKQEGHERPRERDLLDAAREGFKDTIRGIWSNGRIPDAPPILKLTEAESEIGKRRALGKAIDAGIKLTKQSIPVILDAEEHFQVLGTEVKLDFTGVFPFQFSAYADVLLQDPSDWSIFGLIKDCKTAGKSTLPDEWTAWQLATYYLPYWLAGEPYALGIDQVVKTKEPKVNLWTTAGYTLQPTDEEMRALRNMILNAAQDISRDFQRGYFQPAPNGFGDHDYPHPMPRFYVPITAPEDPRERREDSNPTKEDSK